jgi:hypothetical protein
MGCWPPYQNEWSIPCMMSALCSKPKSFSNEINYCFFSKANPIRFKPVAEKIELTRRIL